MAQHSETPESPGNPEGSEALPRRWQAPTLMLFDVRGHTSNFINPAPNADSSTNYFTYAS